MEVKIMIEVPTMLFLIIVAIGLGLFMGVHIPSDDKLQSSFEMFEKEREHMREVQLLKTEIQEKDRIISKLVSDDER